MKLFRRQTLALLGFATASMAIPAAVHAQADAAANYPNKPVKVIVGWSAGGATDSIARALSQKWSQSMGQNFLVENKPGVGGILAAETLARAPADGYTISVFLDSTLNINQFLFKKLPFNPDKDFAFITHLTNGSVVLAARPDAPYQNAKEFADYIQANPGKVKYGSYGMGSLGHVITAFIDETYQGGMTHSPYKGEAPLMQDILNGTVDIGLVSVANSLPHQQSGKIKYLGVTGPKRLQAIPDVPTMTELGLKGDALKMVGWTGIMAPAGTPKPIIDKLVAETHKALQDPEIQKRIMSFGNEVVLKGTPEEAFARYKKDLPAWKKLVEISGAEAN